MSAACRSRTFRPGPALAACRDRSSRLPRRPMSVGPRLARDASTAAGPVTTWATAMSPPARKPSGMDRMYARLQKIQLKTRKSTSNQPISFRNTASIPSCFSPACTGSNISTKKAFSVQAGTSTPICRGRASGRSILQKKSFMPCPRKTDIGADLADGWVQAALKWGREEDLHTGALGFSYWGVPEHGYDPRAELEWGYGSLMGDRDTNTHCFNYIFTNVSAAFAFGKPLRIGAEEMVNLHAKKLSPYAKDRPEVLDYSDDNMYSEAVAQLVRWQQHYCRFYKNSALFCDLKWPDFVNTNVAGS